MGYNILVVDDSETARRFIMKSLQVGGVDIGEIHQAGNGEEALNIINNEWVDIVLSDINMPKMNGIEMVEKMNSDGLMKTIPVVIISTERSEARIESLKHAGICAYIRKPFTPENIKKTVDDILTVPTDTSEGA
ncbi:MAG: response regulator [Spartobacteria bacterium]|nr:response regulator [Spartobacteria bacterium]